ncbi:MAG TPA: hypothetical protein VN154_04210 [Rhizomicrobium sp.]|nr:hypothetical protein [Rhizomicrobium sp.]
MARKSKPQFALRIAIGLVLMLVIVEVLSLFLDVPGDFRVPIAAGSGVFASSIILYFLDIRRRT